MLPTARPETIAEIKSIVRARQDYGAIRSCPRKRASRAKSWVPAFAGTSGVVGLVRQREDLAFLEVGEDVVVRRQRVVVCRRERLVVGLDQALVFRKCVERLADLRPFGRA